LESDTGKLNKWLGLRNSYKQKTQAVTNDHPAITKAKVEYYVTNIEELFLLI
jgi:hypothetical protein